MCVCLFCILLCLKTNCVRCSFVHVLLQTGVKKKRYLQYNKDRNANVRDQHAEGLRQFAELKKSHKSGASIDLSRGKRHTFLEFINSNPTVSVTDAMQTVLDRYKKNTKGYKGS